jgi:hypothetical protein
MQQFADRLGVTKPPEQSGFSAERLGRIAEFFDRQTDLGVIPGWSAVVARTENPCTRRAADSGTSNSGSRSSPERCGGCTP